MPSFLLVGVFGDRVVGAFGSEAGWTCLDTLPFFAFEGVAEVSGDDDDVAEDEEGDVAAVGLAEVGVDGLGVV